VLPASEYLSRESCASKRDGSPSGFSDADRLRSDDRLARQPLHAYLEPDRGLEAVDRSPAAVDRHVEEVDDVAEVVTPRRAPSDEAGGLRLEG
jgi:hypothetical protein